MSEQRCTATEGRARGCTRPRHMRCIPTFLVVPLGSRSTLKRGRGEVRACQSARYSRERVFPPLRGWHAPSAIQCLLMFAVTRQRQREHRSPPDVPKGHNMWPNSSSCSLSLRLGFLAGSRTGEGLPAVAAAAWVTAVPIRSCTLRAKAAVARQALASCRSTATESAAWEARASAAALTTSARSVVRPARISCQSVWLSTARTITRRCSGRSSASTAFHSESSGLSLPEQGR